MHLNPLTLRSFCLQHFPYYHDNNGGVAGVVGEIVNIGKDYVSDDFFVLSTRISSVYVPIEIGLSGFKETVAPAEMDRSLDTRPITSPTDSYPFATVLRLRVLQIVCGITFLIMGTVGFIEEKGQLNLGLGIPAGIATILAAGLYRFFIVM
ncbi:hypothetical protein Trydic_g1413 [Trypoxylus dichotomus]